MQIQFGKKNLKRNICNWFVNFTNLLERFSYASQFSKAFNVNRFLGDDHNGG